MSSDQLRQRIAREAARIMYFREEKEYLRAKLKAARRICQRRPRAAELPSNREIREQIELLARMYEGERRSARLADMRCEALRIMRILEPFRPKLVGSVLTGHVREGSDIDLHVFSDSVEAVCHALEAEGIHPEVEEKTVRKEGQLRRYVHIRFETRFPFELTVYPADMVGHVFRSSITGRPMERASIAQLTALLGEEAPRSATGGKSNPQTAEDNKLDRFQVYYSLLAPLEHVQENLEYHPEGDLLYHSLQVFALAREHLPYDEEFLLAALLHDVGKGIDPTNHVQAALEALEGYITERTAWFIAHHMEAHELHSGKVGQRLRRRLEASEDFEELLLLAECDRAGRVPGVQVPSLEEALQYIQDLADQFGE